jgi:uncharacterized 2Fe-2S/4Fe-4S cluster protein (DUF4445 family)
VPKVTFEPSGNVIEVPPGTHLLDAAREARVLVESPCGGKGTCGKCIVRVTAGEVDSESLGMLPSTAVADGYVLACKTRVLDTPISVEVPEPAAGRDGHFRDEDDTYLIRHELLPKDWEFNPLAVKWLIQVEPPQAEDGLSDLDRLTRAIQAQWGKEEVIYTLRIMREVADALRAENGLVTVTLVRYHAHRHVVGIEAGNQTTRHYAIAVDVGTTTVAVQLIHLSLGRILGTRSEYNDQIVCGEDVISRINYARRPGGLEELRTRVLDTINRLIVQVSHSHGIEPSEITNAVVSANTTMNHLLLGMNPEYIRLAPYTPTVLEVPYLRARAVGIKIDPDSWIYLSPNNGSYVGGDITAGVLCTDLATDTEEISLFIDIGTNGEIVIGNGEFLMSCACSAGPAFEGGGLDCGMRAATGAIEKVDVDPATGCASYATIGNAPPKGICGSGMIDLLAKLFLSGWIDQAGKFDRSRPCASIVVDGKRTHYVIAPAEESATGKPVTLSEIDIENIVRAKAAIYSACALMLDQLGLGFEDLAHIYVAGGFGRFLDLDKAVVLGLLPDVPRDRFVFIGNASLLGSYMVVVSQDFRRRQQELAQRMTYIDLSNDPGYMDQYTAAMFLPHTEPERFPSVAEPQMIGGG